MIRSILLRAGAVALLLSAAHGASAMMKEQSIAEMAAQSSAVVRAQVVSTMSRWNADRSAIVTDVVLGTRETWLGPVVASRTVTVLGGMVGGVGMGSEHQPSFAAGDEVVVFVSRESADGAQIAGYEQGVYRVTGDEAVDRTGRSLALADLRAQVQGAGSHSSVRGPQANSVQAWSPPGNPTPDYGLTGQYWASFPFTYYINPTGSGVATSDVEAVIQQGYNAWTCSSGAWTSYGGTSSRNGTYDGWNDIVFVSFGGPGVYANTTWWYNGSNQILEFDIAFNTYYPWSAYGSVSTVGVADVGTHEEGHSLGLADLYGLGDVEHTMYGYGAYNERKKETPDLDDVMGIEALYAHSRANLAGTTPSGWGGSIVPRLTADATPSWAPMPFAVTGDATCYVNCGMTNNGGDCASPYSTNNLFLDDDFAWWNSWGPGVWGQSYTSGWVNMGLWVRGGRHTLRYTVDANADIVESSEVDNSHAEQFVWAPVTLTPGVAQQRSAPPAPGSGFPYLNDDGFTFTRNSSYAWVVAEAPLGSSSEDYDLKVCTSYFNISSGFTGWAGTSQYGSNEVDFVVGHYGSSQTTYYPAIERYAFGGGADCAVDGIDATYRNSSSYPAQYLHQTMNGNRLTDVYELYLTTGSTYTVTLARESGASDIECAIFPATWGGVYGRNGGLAYSSPVYADEDRLVVTAPADGWYPVVVYRTNGGADAANALQYSLYIDSGTVTGVGDAPAAATALTLRVDDPVLSGAGPATMSFRLASAGDASLRVFDIRGRIVRSLSSASMSAGEHTAQWDGRDERGEPAGNGVYAVRLEANGRAVTRRLTIVR